MVLHPHVILVLQLSMATFFFSKSIKFFACFLKHSQSYFIQSFPQHKVRLFSSLPNAQFVAIEYPQGICSSIFITKDFSGLLVH